MADQSRFYRLIGKLPVPCRNLEEWSRAMAKDGVGRDGLPSVGQDRVGDLYISTLFLGMDHRTPLHGEGPPLLFETIIFEDAENRYQERCATWDAAEAMHKRAVAVAETMQGRARVTLETFMAEWKSKA